MKISQEVLIQGVEDRGRDARAGSGGGDGVMNEMLIVKERSLRD